MKQAFRIALFVALLFALNAVGAYVRADAQFGDSVTPLPVPWSELEAAKLDALSQEGRALESEQRTLTLLRERWQGRVAAFKAAAESTRTGWAWDPDTGKWSTK